MQGQEAASPAYANALREELVVTGRFLQGTSILDADALIRAAGELTEPWWHLSLDAAQRRSVVRRVAQRLSGTNVTSRPMLVAAANRQKRFPIRSVEQHWQHSVLACAAAAGASFPESVRLATSDALWLAHQEVDGAKSLFPFELAVIYDGMVLTSAYGLLYTLRAKPDSHTLRVASHILSHAAVVADRLR
jgi:hypothetical protein